jgi:hypothetical protein
VEADVEIGFSLVDIAARERSGGRVAFGSRALEEAENVVVDIERRWLGLGALPAIFFDHESTNCVGKLRTPGVAQEPPEIGARIPRGSEYQIN